MNCAINYNQALNGIEVCFDKKPGEAIINLLKESGFRWHNAKKLWYAKQNDVTIEIAKKLSEGNTDNIRAESKSDSKNSVLPLWQRVKFTEGNTNTSEYNYNFVGSNYTPGMSTKEIAQIIRSHLKSRFPEVKFSVTSDYNSINITIKSSPYNNKHLAYDPNLTRRDYIKFEEDNNKELNAIINYCKKLLNSYNYDNSDSTTDYYDTGFYGNVSVSCDYVQTEQTEAIKADVENFRLEYEKAQIEEEKRREEEFLKAQKEREEARRRAEETEKIRREQKKAIEQNITYIDLSDDKQYMLKDVRFAELNKNNTLAEYQEEVNRGNYANIDFKVTRELFFTDENAYNYFCNMLLCDFDFIAGTGGSYTDDPRVNSMIDYQNMDSEERKTVKWNNQGIAVYLNGVLKFVIDAQGFSYARYIGLVEDTEHYPVTRPEAETEEIKELKRIAFIVEDISFNVVLENDLIGKWNGNRLYYKAMQKALKNKNIKLNKSIIQQVKNEKLKIELYRLLTWNDELPKQFEEANLKEGEKITIYCFNGFGWVTESRVIYKSFEPCKYAQYENAVKVVFCPEGKRQDYYTHYHIGQKLVIVRGWHNVKDDLLYETVSNSNGLICSKTKYLSCDNQNILDIIDYHEKAGNEILIKDIRNY